MKRISHIGAGLLATAFALSGLPAQAQYANEFHIAKVVKQGTTTQPIAGSGTVEVQVQVNADGTHKVMKVLKSSNEGDNAAALEIAQTSTYRPATKGTTPQTSFYSFVLKFNGKSVANSVDESAGTPGGSEIEALIRDKKYDEAIAKTNVSLISSPGNPQLLQLLGIAQYFKGDEVASATAFAKVPTINKEWANLAASAFAGAAVTQSAVDAEQSMTFAQKAVGLANNANSNFALGVAQLANKQYAAAIATLKPVHDKATGSTKLQIDRELLTAYLGTNDTDGINAMSAEMKTLDPTGNSAALAIGNHYLLMGNAAVQAKDYEGAVKAYDQAIATGDPKVAVTGELGAALAIIQMPKPDYARAKGYAVKAVTGAPDDPNANFAAGIAFAGTGDKKGAITYLKKADDLAKAAGNVGLSLQIENQLKSLQAGP